MKQIYIYWVNKFKRKDLNFLRFKIKKLVLNLEQEQTNRDKKEKQLLKV